MKKKPHRVLDDALMKLDDWRSKSAAAKSRRFCRFDAHGEARLWPGSAGDERDRPIICQIRDISRGGLGVLSPEPAEPGDFWQVQLCNGDVAIATIPGFCRFCRQIVPGAHLIGIEFGIEAGVLLALGVPAEQIALDIAPECPKVDKQTFVSPHCVIEEEAA
jgi:hypothetical protein